MNLNDKLSDEVLYQAVKLERHKKRTVNRLLKILKAAEKDIQLQLKQANITEFQARRINKLAADIRIKILAAHKTLQLEFEGVLPQYVLDYLDETQSILNKSVGVAWASKPSHERVYAAAYAQPFQGKLMREHFKDLPESLSKLVKQQIRIGYLEGETQEQVWQRVNRILRGKQVNFTRTLVNTTLTHFSGFASQQLFRANASAIYGIKWLATLDNRTSEICMVRDGKIYDIDNVPTYPAHYNERSTLVPELKAANQQRFKVPKETRASMDGQVSAKVTYLQWIDRQRYSRKKKVLGAKAAKLSRDGGLAVSDLFKNGRKRKVSELRKDFPDQWKKAFD